MVLNDVIIYVFSPHLESEDENISYFYDFSQSIAEYTKIFAELNVEWNYLAIEYEPSNDAKLIHYTLGTPCLADFKKTEMSDVWWETYQRMTEGLEK
jgi:hypothetical protein